MKKIKKFLIENKNYIITTGLLLLVQGILYYCLKLIQKDPIYFNFPIDDKIPFLGYFIYIYNIFYPFMAISLFFLYKRDKKNYYKAIISAAVGVIISDIIFLFMPTIMFRPVIPNYDIITNFVIKITFFFDSPPLNCFPSIHCLFCFQIVYSFLFSKIKRKNKITFIIIALLIISSTFLVKQHYLYDMVAALLICIMTNLITGIFKLDKIFKNLEK